jgi:hypothetical protein
MNEFFQVIWLGTISATFQRSNDFQKSPSQDEDPEDRLELKYSGWYKGLPAPGQDQFLSENCARKWILDLDNSENTPRYLYPSIQNYNPDDREQWTDSHCDLWEIRRVLWT